MRMRNGVRRKASRGSTPRARSVVYTPIRSVDESRCPVCKRLFCCWDHLLVHQSEDHKLTIYTCIICNKAFGSKPKLLLHLTNHLPLYCHHCEMVLESKASLDNHADLDQHLTTLPKESGELTDGKEMNESSDNSKEEEDGFSSAKEEVEEESCEENEREVNKRNAGEAFDEERVVYVKSATTCSIEEMKVDETKSIVEQVEEESSRLTGGTLVPNPAYQNVTLRTEQRKLLKARRLKHVSKTPDAPALQQKPLAAVSPLIHSSTVDSTPTPSIIEESDRVAADSVVISDLTFESNTSEEIRSNFVLVEHSSTRNESPYIVTDARSEDRFGCPTVDSSDANTPSNGVLVEESSTNEIATESSQSVRTPLLEFDKPNPEDTTRSKGLKRIWQSAIKQPGSRKSTPFRVRFADENSENISCEGAAPILTPKEIGTKPKSGIFSVFSKFVKSAFDSLSSFSSASPDDYTNSSPAYPRNSTPHATLFRNPSGLNFKRKRDDDGSPLVYKRFQVRPRRPLRPTTDVTATSRQVTSSYSREDLNETPLRSYAASYSSPETQFHTASDESGIERIESSPLDGVK